MDLTSVATTVVSSKLNNAVGGLEKGLGLDEESNKQADEYSKAQIERRFQQKKAERQREKAAIHEGRQEQRQRMKDKYTLDFDSSKSSSKKGSSSKAKSKPSASTTAARPEPPQEQPSAGQGGEEDKKCVIS